MSLFQICYGPEIQSIFEVINKQPGIKFQELVKKFQYEENGDITSLVEAVGKFLVNLGFIEIDENKRIFPLIKKFSKLETLKRLTEISNSIKDPSDQNYVFSSLYYELFIRHNELYIKNLHYETNLHYEKCVVSHEKINAWKRIMQYLGLGYRVYGGFYALPHLDLIVDIIQLHQNWEGPFQEFIEKNVDPIIPCVFNGNAYNGVVYGLINLSSTDLIELSKKQDLPFHSYGERKEWNWIKVGGDADDSVHN
ncbi:hypothetical protein [Bacillus sp. V59.32b]|uniref:hypothetical protein n=1 Tax=Bacillus sp. V59.32b TaxID=1758642 RepID=UPI000E3EC96D|nr:hypothetical protein [Bacillus sp. V59.32b]RFU70005.1 hypothetical protein D0463_00590 [Bacillus sp. V59.32b]